MVRVYQISCDCGSVLNVAKVTHFYSEVAAIKRVHQVGRIVNLQLYPTSDVFD